MSEISKTNNESESLNTLETRFINMVKKIVGGKAFYTTKKNALEARRKGDRIYYDARIRGYYIVRPKKRSLF